MAQRIEWNLNGFKPSMKDIVTEALCLYQDYLKIAKHIKESADKLYGGPHHCVVGRNFHGFATIEDSMQCRIDNLKVYVYKSPRWAPKDGI
ncbi:Dynein light chain [Sparganum proliferum]